jgi:hypothetical protein
VCRKNISNCFEELVYISTKIIIIYLYKKVICLSINPSSIGRNAKIASVGCYNWGSLCVFVLRLIYAVKKIIFSILVLSPFLFSHYEILDEL